MDDLDGLLPHRPPWLRLDRLLFVDGTTVVAEKRVSACDPLAAAGLGGPLCIELVAQAAACLMARRSRGRGHHRGYLVAARGWKFPSRAMPGDTLVVTARLRSELGALAGFHGTVRAGEREIAAGEITCAVEIA